MRSSGIGGQAVIEGIMMKNKDKYSIAVRKPDNTIEVVEHEYVSLMEKYAILKLPILRGVASFVESLIIGMKTLTYSASFYEDEEEPGKAERAAGRIFGDKLDSILSGITICISIILAVLIFMVLPYFVSSLFKKYIVSNTLLAILEGVIRLIIFLLYIFLISRMNDIKRVFMYHGAEHKCINCIEHGMELNVENVRKSSKHHKRCGTSFLLVVMIISIIFFIFIRVDSPALRVIVRVLLVPVIAGVSYEFIRLAGKSESRIVDILSRPGMWLQMLTTSEPTDDMIEVAIKAVEKVFDWKAYLNDNGINIEDVKYE
ncbi:DUF1385 domain-containing protein [Falcatimonas sp. MSJ-15]|uniref:DUF1385 domain-containing protein n=1 Tax=Falcatimonas sp. MSJ-15 TaxID=2841515 RepID=UPI001C100A46|nr:DUF1385 domain-containing protein [Falcatimonas sp. MSJ-15]MBU5471435.1 DUF1385 domain-containing protein [Falcatimonas sp. MSJ-15]